VGSASRRQGGFHYLSKAAARDRLDRVRQTPICRPKQVLRYLSRYTRSTLHNAITINRGSGNHHSHWFATGNAAARDAALNVNPHVASMLLPTRQPATAPLRLHLTLATNPITAAAPHNHPPLSHRSRDQGRRGERASWAALVISMGDRHPGRTIDLG
jgi:hypothetical protein